MPDVRKGEGWTAANLDDLGEGPCFRKVRAELGVEEFGVNAVVLPPNYATGRHYHERQEELSTSSSTVRSSSPSATPASPT